MFHTWYMKYECHQHHCKVFGLFNGVDHAVQADRSHQVRTRLALLDQSAIRSSTPTAALTDPACSRHIAYIDTTLLGPEVNTCSVPSPVVTRAGPKASFTGSLRPGNSRRRVYWTCIVYVGMHRPDTPSRIASHPGHIVPRWSHKDADGVIPLAKSFTPGIGSLRRQQHTRSKQCIQRRHRTGYSRQPAAARPSPASGTASDE